MTMLDNLQNLFRPAHRQAEERLARLDRELDVIAREAVARFARGNAAMQMGLFESEPELDAKRQVTIARRR